MVGLEVILVLGAHLHLGMKNDLEIRSQLRSDCSSCLLKLWSAD